MRNFLQLAHSVKIHSLLHAVQRQEELWNQNSLRTLYPNSPHASADDIWLRFNDKSSWEQEPEKVMRELECTNYPAWNSLPQAQTIVHDLMRTVEGTRLGRVMITRLVPGGIIPSHTDAGEYAAYYDRYHVFLQNYPGSNFKAGNDVICPTAGDVYWFNRLAEHSVTNHSKDDRITMIVDIRCNK